MDDRSPGIGLARVFRACRPSTGVSGDLTIKYLGVFNVAKGKRTFQPNNRRRARVHGFRLRMRTRAGRAIVAARRRKGRAKLTA